MEAMKTEPELPGRKSSGVPVEPGLSGRLTKEANVPR